MQVALLVQTWRVSSLNSDTQWQMRVTVGKKYTVSVCTLVWGNKHTIAYGRHLCAHTRSSTLTHSTWCVHLCPAPDQVGCVYIWFVIQRVTEGPWSPSCRRESCSALRDESWKLSWAQIQSQQIPAVKGSVYPPQDYQHVVWMLLSWYNICIQKGLCNTVSRNWLGVD